MTFIQTTPTTEATGDVRAMYARQQDKFGYVPNYAKVFSHRPDIMAHWAELLAGIRSHVERRRFELVTLAAAHALRNSYCSLAHGKALTEFYTADEIRAVLSEDENGPLTQAEVVMMRFARKVARNAAGITAGDVATLKAHRFSDAEIFDIAATAAARAFFASLCDGLGTEADAVYMNLDDELRHSLTVGRPIGFSRPEHLSEDS